MLFHNPLILSKIDKKIKTTLKHAEGKKVAIEKISIKGLKFEKITVHTKVTLLKKQLKLAKTST